MITGRVTDAAVVCGPAAWHHGWQRTDFDQLACAVVAGHLIECSAQVTGGNYSFFIGAYRQRLEQERFEMLLGVRTVLTTEQWERLQRAGVDWVLPVEPRDAEGLERRLQRCDRLIVV